MNSYKEMYEDAFKNENIKQLTAVYTKFEKKGDYVLGAFISKAPVTSTLGGGEYNQYLFESDEGLIKFALGRSSDNEIGSVLREGGIYRIEFMGQEEIAGGRRVNKFKCEEVGFSESVSGMNAEVKKDGRQDDKK